ncbi:MAG: DnaA/Hda family protein [Aurantimonas endophytica]|uniref:DnaA ATPase domain-containing protein n=1 Tax=Aurantimonas endophytica TaxID=1522175 RepID=UPI0030021AA2
MPAQIPLDLPHQASHARDDIVLSASNRLAVEAIDSWPAWRHSVLVIVGPPGSGKSHLASAWAERAGAVPVRRGGVSALLDQPDFRAVLDDIDRCDLAEDELFAVVNAARLGGGTLLATSRRMPRDLTFALADLRSRLAAATVAELGAPDDELLAGVLVKLFADRQIDIDAKALRYLGERMERSLDAARQLVAAVDREALASKERVTRRLLKRVLDRDAEAVRHQTVVSGPYPAATEE